MSKPKNDATQRQSRIAAILKRLQQLNLNDIPADQNTLILSQSAHMDWDWQCWFTQLQDGIFPEVPANSVNAAYFNNYSQTSPNAPSNFVLSWAKNLLVRNPLYYYSVCEMAFLKAFAENPAYKAAFDELKQTGRLMIVGGGVTSPENLLPNGESILRNYLRGKQWTDSVGLEWSTCIWVPDNFGHDSQFPVLVQALGASSVGFARINGACSQTPVKLNQRDYETAKNYLLGAYVNDPTKNNDPGGVTFWWRANDGSEALAHWMQTGYYTQGDSIDHSGSDYNSPNANIDCTGVYASTPSEHLNNYWNNNNPVAPGQTAYVQVSMDFAIPKGIQYNGDRATFDVNDITYTDNLLQMASEWKDAPDDAVAVVGSFVDYVKYVLENNTNNLLTRSFAGDGSDGIYSFKPTPYWMGHYASWPELKGMNYQGTRTILGAETFQKIAELLNLADSSNNQTIDAAWDWLVPSTHHDYIPGTSWNGVRNAVIDGVENDQLHYSLKAISTGKDATSNAQNPIAKGILVPTDDSMVVFNQLGVARANQVVEILADNGAANLPNAPDAIQVLSNGGRLALTSAPTLGFQVQSAYAPPVVPVSVASAGSTIELANEYVRVLISESSAELTDLIDRLSNHSYLGEFGNRISFYADGADSYYWGFESDGYFTLVDCTPVVQNVIVLESGPLRSRVQFTVDYMASSNADAPLQTLTLEYALLAGEPFVRMSVTGNAPSGYSMFTDFESPNFISSIDHGTPYHWDSKPAETFPLNDVMPTFQAAHDFVLARDTNGIQGLTVLLGAGMPNVALDNLNLPGSSVAWGVKTNSRTLTGGLYRCVQADYSSAKMTNNSDVTIQYALGVPTQINGPAAALTSAREYNTPLQAIAPTKGEGTDYSAGFALAQVQEGEHTLITAAKASINNPEGVIVRVYQGSNSAQTITLDFSTIQKLIGQPGIPLVVQIVTALEEPLGTPEPTKSTGLYELKADYAITTLLITAEE